MKLRNKIPLKGKFLYSALVILFAVLTIPAIKLFTGANASRSGSEGDTSTTSTRFTSWRQLTLARSKSGGDSYTTPVIFNDVQPLYCLNHDLEEPDSTEYDKNTVEEEAYSDPRMLGALYYGFGGKDKSLQQKHNISNDEAQWATQMAVWIHAKALGIENNTIKSIDVNDMNFDNPSVGNYLKELLTKTQNVSETTSSAQNTSPVSLTNEQHFRENGYEVITYDINTGAGANPNNWTFNKTAGGSDVIIEKTTDNKLKIKKPIGLADTVTGTVSRDPSTITQDTHKIDSLVWISTVDPGKQNLIQLNDETTSTTTTVPPTSFRAAFVASNKDLTVEITKTDNESNRVQGVVFEVATDNAFTQNKKEITTTTNGTAQAVYTVAESLNSFTLYIREKSAPAHLIKSNEVKQVTFTGNERSKQVSFVNELKTGHVEITKVDENNNPVSGVVFEIADNNNFTNSQRLTTGANGIVNSSAIKFPANQSQVTMYVREVSAPSHLIVSNEVKTVTLNDNNRLGRVTFVNNIKKVDVRITKTLVGGGDVSGVVFEVSANRNFPAGEVWTLQPTNNNGQTIGHNIPLKNGETSKTLWVREKSVPSHMVLNNTPKSITIQAGQTGELRFENEPKAYQSIKIIKKDETGKLVPGVVFEIADNKDFNNSIEDTTKPNGSTVLTTGILSSPNDSLSKTYYIREKSVPSHLVLSDEVKTITVKAEENATLRNVKFVTVEFINKLKRHNVELSKSDLSNSAPIEGVTLTIYKAEDKNNTNKIFEQVTDKTGKLKGLSLLPGKYKFYETHATIGYKINPNAHYFEVKNDGKVIGETNMTDERQDYDFIINKVDDKGNKVAGVVFSVKNKLTGKEVQATTDKDGIAHFHGIWGEYEIREVSAPKGLIKDEKTYTLNLNKDGSYEKIKVVNKTIPSEQPALPKTGEGKNDQSGILISMAVAFSSLLGLTVAFMVKKH